MIGTYNIGLKAAYKNPKLIFISHYDPDTTTFTFVDADLDLGELRQEIERVKVKANTWVQGLESRAGTPPFA
jgi:hypothetical protein